MTLGVWKKQFAYFPVLLDDDSIIWLEEYEAMDEWCTLLDVPVLWRWTREVVQ